MQRSTFYINKLERHRTHLYKTALSFGQERLLRELRSPTPIEQEYKSFFHESTGYSYRFIPISWKKPTHCCGTGSK